MRPQLSFFLVLFGLPALVVGVVVWNAISGERSKIEAWAQWCTRVGGVPLHARPDTCIAKEVVITKDNK